MIIQCLTRAFATEIALIGRNGTARVNFEKRSVITTMCLWPFEPRVIRPNISIAMNSNDFDSLNGFNGV